MLEAEILAIREGLMLSLQWSNLPIDIESDNLKAVNMLKSANTNRSRYIFLVREIKENMFKRSSCITHIQRSQHFASHFMTTFGRIQVRTAVWLGV